ncbi:MAG: class I SAM-dependent methyltransferase [Planctomycetota bacterium]
MTYDNRYDAADYYERFHQPPWNDIAFYLDRVPEHNVRVLELGCGTGRVMLPMTEQAGYVLGVDLSQAMLDICDRKLEDAGINPSKARTLCADITTLDVTGSEPLFDRISAPFRVMQNLETDEQVDGLMQTIKRHLKPGGEAVLNTFKPRDGGYEALAEFWSSQDGSTISKTFDDGQQTVTLTDDCRVYRPDPVRIYPKLIYRRYNAEGEQIDEAVLDIVMRIWQPDEFIALIERHGFTITEKLGGYAGEPWGEGSELIIAFTHD